MKDIQKLEIERIALHGYGIGHGMGRTIFVPYTAPGDLVDIRITLQKKDIAFAEVTRYHQRNPDIITPDCEAFGPPAACGGCDWLMAPYRLQLSWKDHLIRGVFESFVDSSLIKPIVASPQPDHYRNKAFFPVSSRKSMLIYGMYQSRSHYVIPHKSCKIQNTKFDLIAAKVLKLAEKAGVQAYQEAKHSGNLRQIGMRANHDASQIVLILVTKSGRLPFAGLLIKQISTAFPEISGIVQNIQRERSNVILGHEDKLLWGKNYIEERILGNSYRAHYRSFLQVNHGVNSLILECMKTIAGQGKRILDAYSGIGSIALSLASQSHSVLGIEEVPEAVEDARLNAKLNGITNAQFDCARVEDVLDQSTEHSWDMVVFDPPRSGLADTIPDIIAEAGIREILYLSCNPMTLARDLKAFVSKGYQILEIQPFDMFPHTWHIETLAYLKRK